MGIKRQILTISLCFLLSVNLFAQKLLDRDLFFSPGISVGYTLGAKMNFGFTFDFGLIDKTNNDLCYGLSFSYYNLGYKDMRHKQRSLNLILQNDFFTFRLGSGRMKNGWGYQDRNRCIVHGFSGDISITYPKIYIPNFGYKAFLYNKENWAWFTRQYQSFYLGYDLNKLKNN